MSNAPPHLKAEPQSKRKKVSTACLPCRKRKVRCDGRVPSCLACQIHGTTCAYDFERDSRKTPSKAYISALKARIAALERCLDDLLVAETVEEREQLIVLLREQRHRRDQAADAGVFGSTTAESEASVVLDAQKDSGEEDDVLREMTSLMTRLHVDNEGVIYSAGATSNISDMKPSRRHHAALSDESVSPPAHSPPMMGLQPVQLTPLEHHLLRLYFTWQHPVFYLFSPDRFLRDLSCGGGPCFSPLLLSTMLAIGCHHSDHVDASRGDEYFAQAKTLLASELERPSLTTCQALVMMGTREAGCGKDRGSGWLYSGMGFRMAVDLGIHLNSRELHNLGYLSAEAVEERELTFWGSFVADKGWTAYLGRPESLPCSNIAQGVPLPTQAAGTSHVPWRVYTDSDLSDLTVVDSSTSLSTSSDLAAFRHLSTLVAILGAIVRDLYHKDQSDTSPRHHVSSRTVQPIVVSALHTRLLNWHHELPQYMRLSAHQSAPTPTPVVLLVHMFYHAAIILLFRPFIHRTGSSHHCGPSTTSPLETCTASALTITRCLQQYRRLYTLRRYVDWLIHAVLTAATIHVINAAPGLGCNTAPASKGNIACEPKEAIRRLQETMTALSEMGRAWKAANRCFLQVKAWVERYGIEMGLDIDEQKSITPKEEYLPSPGLKDKALGPFVASDATPDQWSFSEPIWDNLEFDAAGLSLPEYDMEFWDMAE
ncbi:hypothetical protein CONLIGDRAFT_590068 [Coniochaeta ligniaria NRRL 30616]|uniref:Zn(2)-C6 fungal-type domain-containing protein n=1 Tax=Coniochaeta ligniaria NRRL 30616 TaxID=1408157 RepID=A0A1J7JHT8_9PEZI|nr:hypothetical protein CONLIGDRAFT_590068 [Coniochaeta ligniaria NRRL 30616]